MRDGRDEEKVFITEFEREDGKYEGLRIKAAFWEAARANVYCFR